VLIAVGVVLTSCSGDNDSDGDTTVAGSVEETTAATEAPAGTDAPDDTALTGEGLAVGVVAPSQGLLTSLFQGQTRGIDFAVADIADGGGVLEGPLDVTTEQTPLDEIGADVVPTLVDGGAQGLIGPAGSDSGTEYREAVAAADSISCSASATLPGLTYGQESFGLFRTALPDDVLVSYIADTIIERRDTEAPGAVWNVAIVARSDDYGLAVGNPADLVLWNARTPAEVVATIAQPLAAFKRGRRLFTREVPELIRG
jgi:ABC-type branched-subunit amino acid transport system substrate-binding protein